MRIFFAIMLVLLLAVRVSACSCMASLLPSEALSGSDVVFAGKVLEVAYEHSNPWGDQLVRFRVRREWKGSSGEVVAVVTGSGGGDCGYPFELGKYYLVYAYRQDDQRLYTGICTRTQALRDAREDLTTFGEPDLLTSVVREEQTELFGRFGVFAACVLALLAIFFLKRRRGPQPA